MAGDIGNPQRFPYLVHVPEQSQALRQGVQARSFRGRESRGNEVLYGPRRLEREEGSISSTGQGTCVVNDLLENDIEIEALTHQATGLTEFREPHPSDSISCSRASSSTRRTMSRRSTGGQSLLLGEHWSLGCPFRERLAVA